MAEWSYIQRLVDTRRLADVDERVVFTKASLISMASDVLARGQGDEVSRRVQRDVRAVVQGIPPSAVYTVADLRYVLSVFEVATDVAEDGHAWTRWTWHR